LVAAGLPITIGEVRTPSAIAERERRGRRSADGRLPLSSFNAAASSVRFRAGDVRSGYAPAHGEADADARNDRANAAGEPRPRAIVEEQVLRHDTELDP